MPPRQRQNSQAIPRVVFRIIPPNDEIGYIHRMLLNTGGWHRSIEFHLPDLAGVRRMPRHKQQPFIRKFLKRYWADHSVEIHRHHRQSVAHFHSLEQKFLKALAVVLEIDWPKPRRTIIGYTSVNPVCPRDLDRWDFTWNYRSTPDQMAGTSMHEIVHFLYFVKWHQVFPDMPGRKYDAPYMAWRLSEILAPVLLMDPRLQKFIRHRPRDYDIHRETKISGLSVTERYDRMYRKYRKRRRPFAEFLEAAYADLCAHRRVFPKSPL